MQRLLYVCLLMVCTWLASAQLLPYKNASLPINQRVQDLLHRMTPEEKFRQLFMVSSDFFKDSADMHSGLFGFQLQTSANQTDLQRLHYHHTLNIDDQINEANRIQRFFVEQTRLGIPVIFFDEALHGLVRQDATAFPQAIAMAASFDTCLMRKACLAIGSESYARGIRMILSPVINVATDVRWGRVEETYGEDPLLTSRMGVAYVKAMHDKHIITTPKHFIINHGEGGRDSYPIFTNDRYLLELYGRPFKACIQEGGAVSLMSAYNSLNGRPCSANKNLLHHLLRNIWHFNGFVISDAAAVGGANVLHFTATDYEDAGKQSIENGLDVIFQSDFSSYQLFKKPFLTQQVQPAAFDSAVARVLYQKFALGLFEHPYISSSTSVNLDTTYHKKLAYDMAAESMVLLTNKNNTLPLAKTVTNIALIGESAREIKLGGYSGPGNHPVSILSAFQYSFMPNTHIHYAEGYSTQQEQYIPIPGKNLFHITNQSLTPGLIGRYFNSIDLRAKPTLERIDPSIQFQWTLFSPAPNIPYDHFAVDWSGIIIPDFSGKCDIGIEGNDGYTVSINGKEILNRWNEQSYHTTTVPYQFEAGKQYHIHIQYREKSGNAKFKLIWSNPDFISEQQLIQEAVNKANLSDIIILVTNIKEGEFQDRSKLSLPSNQLQLIDALSTCKKPFIVVLQAGSAVLMNEWINKVDAILDMWYAGEMGGYALADVLNGTKNPCGKLPITFPMHEGQLPLYYHHYPTGRGDDYIDASGQALFPFGYGLSYTQFDYQDLTLNRTNFTAGDTVQLDFTITNTGNVEGQEIIQLYMRDEIAQIARPIKQLIDFKKVRLHAGEQQKISFLINAQMLSYLNDQLESITEPGSFILMIGSSSKDIRLRTQINYIE